MGARTGAEYLKGLQESTREIWLGGESVTDVVHHPQFRQAAQAMAHWFDLQYANPDKLKRVLAAMSKSVAWFEDDRNRAEAIEMLVKASKINRDDVVKAYDFFRKGKFFESSGTISRKRMTALISALVSLGDIGKIDLDKLVLPGLVQVVD